MDVLPPCGIGGAPTVDHPCTGSSGSPNDAGGGVFSGITGTHVATAIIAAGAILVGLLFTVWAVRKVGTFFRGRGSRADELTPDGFLQRHGAAYGRRSAGGGVGALSVSSPDADFTAYGRGDSDAEWDTEDDSPDDEPEDDRGQLRLEHGK